MNCDILHEQCTRKSLCFCLVEEYTPPNTKYKFGRRKKTLCRLARQTDVPDEMPTSHGDEAFTQVASCVLLHLPGTMSLCY